MKNGAIGTTTSNSRPSSKNAGTQGAETAGAVDKKGDATFSRGNHEEVTFGRGTISGRENYAIVFLDTRQPFRLWRNLPPRGAGACFLADQWPIPRRALFDRVVWQPYRCHRLMTYALIASKTATLTAITIKKNFPIAPPFAVHNARQQE
ncbi:hypothetical protein [Bradyrhizobium sp. AZCC 1721]|uniref:hypothetical protein n=1 Tax=Bradyrhizobium sp. AZCC 1721 TaxID=3117016 RepID=UPI002FF3A057